LTYIPALVIAMPSFIHLLMLEYTIFTVEQKKLCLYRVNSPIIGIVIVIENFSTQLKIGLVVD